MLNINTDFFTKGTVILEVDAVSNRVKLSTNALKSDNPTSNPNLAFTFAGSRFTSSGTPSGSQITNIDANVGIDLVKGMAVLGSTITGRVTITDISANYKTLTLSGPAGTGPYTFQGAPASYVVSTLINNWYAWADYYFQNNTAVDVPNIRADAGRVGTLLPLPDKVAAGSREDPNMLVLKNLTAVDIGKLRVGDVVTSPGTNLIVPDANPLVPFKQTTIAAIDVKKNSITLSNPLSGSAANALFSFSKPVKLPRSVDAKPYTLSFAAGKDSEDALKFAQSVYDVMAGWAHLTDSDSYLSQSALLLDYVIGGNIGTFALQAGEALPTVRLDQLRDELKSVLRGVYDFSKIPEFDKNGNEQWYPSPKDDLLHPAMITPFGGGMTAYANFGVYNLNPYVWFIHIKLGMSGYGFSLDDDTANAQDRASSLEATCGTTQNLKNPQEYTYGAPFGLQTDTGYVDTTSGFADGYDLTKYTVISGLSVATVGKLNAFDAKQGQGALVVGKYMPTGARCFTTAAFLLSTETRVMSS